MIQAFADWIVYDLMGLSAQTHFGGALNFFLYDSIKIFFLLFLISGLMGIINAYFPIERVRDFLTTRKLFGLQYLAASLFGAVTPFCSCSSIPLFIGFVKGGIPLGVTFSFLITSPLVNEVAIAMFLGTFGLKATAIYAGSGILLGVVGGWVLGRMKLEHLLTPWVQDIMNSSEQESETWAENKIPFLQRLPVILKDSWAIVRGVLPYVFIAVALGAFMHSYIPDGFFQHALSSGKWYTVPLTVLAAVPLYASASAIVPVIQVFVIKGVPLGTAIAFMMAVVGLSFPEAMMLKKVMRLKLIGIFFGLVSLFIILSGYLFNILL